LQSTNNDSKDDNDDNDGPVSYLDGAPFAASLKRSESVGSVKGGGISARKLLSVFAGPRKSFDLKKSYDLKSSRQANDGHADEAGDDMVLIKAMRHSEPSSHTSQDEIVHAVSLGAPSQGGIDELHPLNGSLLNDVSQMTTHDVIHNGSESSTVVEDSSLPKELGVPVGLAGAEDSNVPLCLKRTAEDQDEAWYTTLSEETFVDTAAMAREAAMGYRLAVLEDKIIGLDEAIGECLSQSMKMECITKQIQNMASNATKAQADIEFRIHALGKLLQDGQEGNVANRCHKLEGRVRELTSHLAQIEDDWEQDQIEKMKAMEREREGSGRKVPRHVAVFGFLLRQVVLPLLISVVVGRKNV